MGGDGDGDSSGDDDDGDGDNLLLCDEQMFQIQNNIWSWLALHQRIHCMCK